MDLSNCAPADGIAVMHFRGPDDRRARYEDHAEEAQRGFVDAARFMDMERTHSALMHETIWKDNLLSR